MAPVVAKTGLLVDFFRTHARRRVADSLHSSRMFGWRFWVPLLMLASWSASASLDFKLGAAASLGFGLDVDVLLLTEAQKLRDAANQRLQLEQIDRDTVGFHLRPQVHLTWHI
jgi:hypothetical protein